MYAEKNIFIVHKFCFLKRDTGKIAANVGTKSREDYLYRASEKNRTEAMKKSNGNHISSKTNSFLFAEVIRQKKEPLIHFF